MHKISFVKRVAQKNQKPQVPQRVYNQVLKELSTGIQQELAAGRKVHFLGLGTFYTRVRKPSKARYFKTKKVIDVPALHLPAFRPVSEG